MRVLLMVIMIVSCVLIMFGCTTEQLSANGKESNPYELVLSPVESDEDSQYSPQSESLSREQLILVHESLPDFMLQLRGAQNIFTELSIVNSVTGDVVYKADLTENRGILEEMHTVETIDVDFDGYQDIDIFTGYTGNWKTEHIYIIWDQETSSFAGDIYDLASLGLPTFDAERKLVHSMQRASATDHWYYTHQYIDGKLVTTEEEALSGIQALSRDDLTKEQIKTIEPLYQEDRTMFLQYVQRQLNTETMEMDIVDFKFLLNDIPDAILLAEYAPDSEIGLLLAQYETSSDIYGR